MDSVGLHGGIKGSRTWAAVGTGISSSTGGSGLQLLGGSRSEFEGLKVMTCSILGSWEDVLAHPVNANIRRALTNRSCICSHKAK